MAQELTLPELLDALRTRWKLVAAVAILVTAGTTVYAERLPDQFEGLAIVSVAPRPDAPTVSADLVTVGAPKYVAFGSAPSTLQRIASSIGEDREVLEDSAELTLAPDTGDITIRVELPSPGRAASAANAFAAELVEFSTTDPLLTADLTAPAARPSEPAGPPRRLMEAAALVVGALLGVAVAFVMERGRPRLRSVREVAEVCGYPVVGRLPLSKAYRRGVRRIVDPLVAAAARGLRTNIEREIGAELRGVLIVTSALPGEGKTSTAAVFATVLARLNLRVLLVDGDLHKADLSHRLSADTQPGLAGVLGNKGALDNHVRPGWAEGLWVLTTSRSTNAGELLALHFRDVAKRARQVFDVVVIDTPPLLGADDTTTMATAVDGVLLVVSLGTLAEPVQEASLALRALRVPVWGVVANRVPRTGPGGATSYPYYQRAT